ncbi:RsmB/NOP family class I SAM-dependent RNA methyltransferase [Pseudothioclava nitratireducens]|uniref:RsmB/NOP family class I SAM-dependent RNA methyltransferase n=1 Tax=Pseudothioclava nitratireducens TaxID=1928646 RepID=UPI0023DB066A|nr:RsmB/NOP family class I SAM-dependent RNA methyltransferase [Defluviimonas nitratireducens]MDF1621579.1 RsmB/NOP family class I SAM-dependent RNA methyltransferase [Defluviimonas nitratireducens]
MTPAARLSAAIDILDQIRAGGPAEQVLTNWARGNRFAGSGDRAAIRDLVFDALRCWRSFAALGGAETGRGMMLGALRARGVDPSTLFTGARFAPAPLSAAESAAGHDPGPQARARMDWPDWLIPQLEESLGEDFAAVSLLMQARAPGFLRINHARTDRAGAIAALAAEGIVAAPHPLAETALEVQDGARRVQRSKAYETGLVELQDAASQAAVEDLPLVPGLRVLDYCAGGGGKALAMAAACPEARISAHDIDAGRMRDLAPRAARAGARIETCAPGQARGVYDLVLVDAPCSGSGTWRRTPEAKWRLTPERLAELCALQADILTRASDHVAPGGRLAYMTCSLLRAENEDRIAAFSAQGGWRIESQRRLGPLAGGDGFFVTVLKKD